MKPNVHIHVSVSDIDRSAAFYEKLFGAPVKVKPGYRKFLPAFAPLNLALSDHGGPLAGHAPVNHLGVQFDSPADVGRELARVKAQGLPVREEMGVSCCHANQDKFWVRDPDGVEWEFYSINFDIEEPAPTASQETGCCGTQSSSDRRGACGA